MGHYNKPDIDIYSYVIDMKASDKLYANVETIEGEYTIKEEESGGWRYAIVYSKPTLIGETAYSNEITVGDLVSMYKFVNLNGRKVSLMGCKDKLCLCPTDAPDGQVTPDMTGFVYRLIQLSDKGLGSINQIIDGERCQVVSENVEGIMKMVKDMTGDPVDTLMTLNHFIEYIPIAKLYRQCNYLKFVSGKVVDLQAIDALAPEPDEEEILLSKLDSTAKDW